jgi:hypothetical protein
MSCEIHCHFVLLGYVQDSYDYVGSVVIYFQEVKGLSIGVQFTNNLKNKHSFISSSLGNMCILHNDNLKVKGYESSHTSSLLQ